jgi:hypothetical protein
LRSTGLRPLLLGKFHRHGIELPVGLFQNAAIPMNALRATP